MKKLSIVLLLAFVLVFGAMPAEEAFAATDNNLSVSIDVTPIINAGYEYANYWTYGVDVYVPLRNSVQLKVNATADYTYGMTYHWYESDYEGDGNWGTLYGLTGNSPILNTDSITYYCRYLCEVIDYYGNTSSVNFYIHVDNGFSAEADKSNGKWVWNDLYVSYMDTPTLKVDVAADNTSGISYQWRKRVYNNEGYLEEEFTIGSNSPTLASDPVKYYTVYYCVVRDRYGNENTIWFNVHVDNDLNVVAASSTGRWEYNELYVSYGASPTLKANTSASSTIGITYKWYNDWTEITGATSNTLNIGSVTKYSSYYCEVRDRYGNEVTVYFYVHVDNGLDLAAVGDTTVYVPYLGTAPLKVRATANNTTGLTYTWYKNWTEISGATSNSLNTDSITENTTYFCRATDRYGNGKTVYFDVYVQNHLRATAYGTDSDFMEMEVEAGSSSVLRVKAEADDLSGISYQWYSLIPGTDANGEPDLNASPTDLAPLGTSDIQGVTVRKSEWFFSEIIDRFKNRVVVFFHVKVANDLTVTPTNETIEVSVGSSQTLSVTASAHDMEDISYAWFKAGYDDQDNLIWEDVPGSGASLSLTNITKPAIYRCRVTDKFDNYVYAVFNITLTGTDHIPGDINGDGSVNNKDVTRLMRYIKYKDVEVVGSALDANGDGVVNNKDVTRLMRYIKYGDVEIF